MKVLSLFTIFVNFIKIQFSDLNSILESPSATYELLLENKTDKKLMKMHRFAVSDLVPAIL